MTSRAGEAEQIQFLVGTQAPRHDNQVLLLNFDEVSSIGRLGERAIGLT
jgi:hypothetical protein